MALKLMYITNDPQVALIAEEAGVDSIFIDMEYIGKADRQGGMDTVQSHHTVEDVRRIKSVLTKAKLMVRVNPIHDAGEYLGLPHTSSKEEIDAVIEAGADVVMLPYFKTAEEVRTFIQLVDGRAVTLPLLETVEAAEQLDEILEISGLDQIHIGLNDLNLERGGLFMFGLMKDGTVENLVNKCKVKEIPFGIGGFASPGPNLLPAEYIITEHYRLGSSCAILSRAFCNTQLVTDYDEIRTIFQTGMKAIRSLEETLAQKKLEKDADFFTNNKAELDRCVTMVEEAIAKKRGLR